jgi:hypothetical protein
MNTELSQIDVASDWVQNSDVSPVVRVFLTALAAQWRVGSLPHP